MLTKRSVILGILLVACLTAATALGMSLWRGATHSTLGSNSYGTRAEGYGAIYDLLQALEFETERALIPVTRPNPLGTSYVLWHPRTQIVHTEPAYLNQLAEWVRAGGYLVVTPSAERDPAGRADDQQCAAGSCVSALPVSLFRELGLGELAVEEVQLPGADEAPPPNDKEESLRKTVRDIFQATARPSTAYAVSCTGAWEHLESQVQRIELPSDQACYIKHGKLEPLAQITVDGGNQEAAGMLAAMYPLGKGRITVISNPFLASNAYLIPADNSVLLTHLLTNRRRRVVFDEFYHGLTVRGNALWLLSQRPYAVLVASVLVVVGVWVWRQAVFLGPSREQRSVPRRTLDEYLEAMSRFLLQGRESSTYILRALRQGVLWHYCKTLGLPPQQQDVGLVLGMLSRRSPDKALQLEAALREADTVLQKPRARQDEILLATRKVSDCLST